MAVTAEELEIRVKTNAKEALAGLTQLRGRLEQLKGQMQLGNQLQASLKLAHKQIHKTMAVVAKEQEKLQAKVQAVQHKSQAQVQTALQREQTKRVQAKRLVEKQTKAEYARAGAAQQSAKRMIQAQKAAKGADSKSGAAPKGATPKSALPKGAAPKAAVPNGAALKAAVPDGALPKDATPKSALPAAGAGQSKQWSLAQAAAAQYSALLDQLKGKLGQVGLSGGQLAQRMGAPLEQAGGEAQRFMSSLQMAVVVLENCGSQAQRSAQKVQSVFAKLGASIKNLLAQAAAGAASALTSGLLYAAQEGLGHLAQASEQANATLSRLVTGLLYVKNSIAAAFLPALQVIEPVLSAVMNRVAQCFNVIAMFTARLFGNASTVTVAKKAQVGYAQSIGATAAAEQQHAQAVEETNEALKGQLAAMDELNVIGPQNDQQQPSKQDAAAPGAAGGPAFGEMFQQVPIPQNILQFVEKLKQAFEGLKSNLKGLWETYFAQPFADAWAKLLPQLAALKETFAGIFSDLAALAAPLTEWFYSDAIPMLQQLITSAGGVLAGLLESVNLVLSGFWEALYPAIQAFIEYALPVITEFITQVILTFESWFTQAKLIFDTLWLEVIQPLLLLGSEQFQTMLETLKTLWDEWGEPTFEQLRLTFTQLGETFQQIWETTLSPVFEHLIETLGALWQEHLAPLMEKLGEFAFAFVNAALQVYNGFILPVVQWCAQTFGPAIATGINDLIKLIGDLVAGIADFCTQMIDSWKGLLEFITGVFTGDWARAWDGIKQYFTGVWGMIQTLASSALRYISNRIAGVVNRVKEAIQTVKRFFSLGGEDEDDAQIGPQPHGGEYMPALPPVSRALGMLGDRFVFPAVPELASGGVIRHRTLAMLGEYGDAATNPEIAAPQNLLQETFVQSMLPLARAFHQDIQALGQLLSRAIQENGVQLSADASGIFELVRREADSWQRMTNTPAFAY
ncbi:MAG: hypothetical protein HFG20_05710 [Anaerotruncus sp.]|nr:hypothetical protein [Anaerotruncus sp.]